MRNTAIRDKAEFETRQQCLEFGAACRFVLDLAVSVKKSLTDYATGILRKFRMPRPDMKKPEQLRLDLLPWMALQIIQN